MATVLALVVLAGACTEPGAWTDTAPEPAGFTYYASSVQDSACATPDACVVVGSSAASVWDGTAWAETEVPPGAYFGFVTCGAPSFCLANVSRTSDGAEAPLSRLDGTRWVPAPDPTGALAGAAVTDAVCTGPEFCMAAATRAGAGELLRWDGTAWTRTPTPTPPVGVLRLDCASPQSCLATAAIGQSIAAYTWDGQAWALAPAPPVSTSTLSCGEPDACLVAGWQLATGVPGLAAWDGTAWSTAPMPPARIHALDCVTAEWCMAVTGAPQASQHVFEGGAWRNVPLPEGVPAASLTSVACSYDDACLVTGSRVDTGATHRAAVWWDGATWAGQPDLPRPTRPRGRFQAVSCTFELWCAAVGAGLNGAAPMPIVQVRKGQRWTTVPVPADVVPDPELDISCATSSFCVIVGLGAGAGGLRDRALQWDGRALRTVDLRPVLGSLRGPTRVSCPTSSSCLATGGGATLRYDGSAWTAVPNPGGSVRDVDCVSATSCRATGLLAGPLGLQGVINRWDGTAWVQDLLPVLEGAPSFGESISCADADHCIVAARATPLLDPLVLTWNGLAWLPSPVAVDRDDPAVAVGCTNVRRCVVATASGAQPSAVFTTRDVLTGPWAPAAPLPRAAGWSPVVTGMACRPLSCLVVGYQVSGQSEQPYAAQLYLGDPAQPA